MLGIHYEKRKTMKLIARLRSVRAVLTFWYSTILLIAFTLFAGSTYFYLHVLLLETLDQELADEADWVIRIVSLEQHTARDAVHATALPENLQTLLDDHFAKSTRNYIVLLNSEDGKILYESENRAGLVLHEGEVPAGEPVYVSKQTPKGTVRITARRSGPLILQIAYPERPVDLALDHLLSIFALLAPVALLFAVSGGWLLARFALRPIDNITEMAQRISAQNLAERIPERKVPDEIGRLIGTLNTMIERLQISFSQIRQFSMNVAHELRTPLTILKGESELALNKTLTSEQAQQLAQTYLEETVRLSRIVDDLLTLAKADAGQMKIQREALRLDRLVAEVYEDAQLLASDRNLSAVLERNDEIVIEGDSTRLRQLLRNLLMNAIQYTPAGGTIRIASRHLDQSVEVTVQDTGIGISAHDLPNIFQPFYRSETARNHAPGGSGLGLSISRWIAQAHGGEIHVSSTAGEGSTFRVVLPLRDFHTTSGTTDTGHHLRRE